MRHWTTKYQMRFFIAVLQLSIILCYDTLKILKSGLDRGPIIFSLKLALYFQDRKEEWVKIEPPSMARDMKYLKERAVIELREKKKIIYDIEHPDSKKIEDQS